MRKVTAKDQTNSTYFAVFFVEIQFPLEICEVEMWMEDWMVLVRIHHWIEDELDVHPAYDKTNLCAAFAESISKD